MENKIMTILMLLLMPVFLTGCWDSVEIDRKAFVSTVAVDVNEEKTANNYDDKFAVTYSFPDIRKMDAEKGSAEKVSLSVNGYSITDAYIKAVSTTSRNLHFGHSKLLLVSKDIYKYPELVTEFMDYIERTPDINRAMKIAIIDGKASECLDLKPLLEDGVDNYIINILGNSSRRGNFRLITITNYIDKVKSETPVIIPVFKVKEDKTIELTSGAAIRGTELLYSLSKEVVDDIDLLQGDIGGCKKSIIMNNHPIDFYIRSVSRRIKPKYEDGILKLNINLICEGELSSYYSNADSLNTAKVSEIEKLLNKSMEYELLQVMEEVMDGSESDVVGIGEYLKKYHNSIWREVGEGWPKKLSEAEITISVDNKIKSVGISN